MLCGVPKLFLVFLQKLKNISAYAIGNLSMAA